jgi:hypothetical protein
MNTKVAEAYKITNRFLKRRQVEAGLNRKSLIFEVLRALSVLWVP